MLRFVIILSLSFLLAAQTNTFAQDGFKSSDQRVEYLDLFSQAGIFLLKSQTDKALQYYQRCIELNPKSSASYFQIANIHFGSGNFQASELFAQKAVDIQPSNVLYLNLLADANLKNGNLDAALSNTKKALELYPSYENYHALTELYISSGKFSDAISLLDSFEKNFGYDISNGVRKSELYRMSGNLPDAEKELMRIVDTDSTNIYYRFMLAGLYFQTGQIPKVQPVINQMEKIDSENGLVYLAKSSLCRATLKVDCFYQNLIRSLESDDVLFSEKLMQLSIVVTEEQLLTPNQVDSLFSVMKVHYPDSSSVYSLYADYLFFNKEYTKSIKELSSALSLNKNDFILWRKLFHLYNINEDYQHLDETVNDAFSYYPEQLDVFLYAALSSFLTGHLSDGEDYLIQAESFGVEESSSAYFFYFIKGVYYYLKNDSKNSLEFFNKYFLMGNSSHFMLAQYAFYLIQMNTKMDLAERIIKQCVSFDQTNTYFYYVYANYFLKKNDLKSSEYFIDKSLSLDHCGISSIYELAGDIYSKNNNCEKAVLYWNKAKNDSNTQKLLNKIKNCN